MKLKFKPVCSVNSKAGWNIFAVAKSLSKLQVTDKSCPAHWNNSCTVSISYISSWSDNHEQYAAAHQSIYSDSPILACSSMATSASFLFSKYPSASDITLFLASSKTKNRAKPGVLLFKFNAVYGRSILITTRRFLARSRGLLLGDACLRSPWPVTSIRSDSTPSWAK